MSISLGSNDLPKDFDQFQMDFIYFFRMHSVGAAGDVLVGRDFKTPETTKWDSDNPVARATETPLKLSADPAARETTPSSI